ncbi:MAG: hypothetical protein J7500_05180 [Sphingomonas sp.]|uniref:hypothetical protein n=1 Tax=Sphingomonas sp. TaxID=28214 RepID=UPI001B279426|nr:hypothetical protein [Sphingomonas sp.]MBO9622087.1 hypothetical protein [Sphingomonas sp.]
MADIGAIIGGGFGLIRRHPGSVVVWGVIAAASGAAIGWLQFRTGLMATEPSGLDLGRHALRLALGLLSFVISTILSAAALRAVLDPGAGGFAYLRLGADEARMIGLTLLLYVLALIAGVIGTLGFAFLVALFGFLTFGNAAVAQLLAGLLALAVFAGVVFVLVRLSLVYPLVLVRRRISIDDSWELTRGHFWSLLGAYVLLALISFALIFAVMLPVAGMHVQAAASGGWQSWSATTPLDYRDLASLKSTVLVALVASAAINALLLALWSGALATATLGLLDSKNGAQMLEEGEYSPDD